MEEEYLEKRLKSQEEKVEDMIQHHDRRLMRILSENFISLTWMVAFICMTFVLSCFTDCVMKNNTEDNKRYYDMEKIKLDNEIRRLRKLEKKVINDAIGYTE
jgi:hypothetical protein